jgi:hypothetical protein
VSEVCRDFHPDSVSAHLDGKISEIGVASHEITTSGRISMESSSASIAIIKSTFALA